MKVILSFLFLSFFYSTTCFSQGQTNKTIIETLKDYVPSSMIISLTFNTYTTKSTDIMDFKNDLIEMSPGVFEVDFDENRNSFSFSCNKQVKKEELINLFKKHNMSNLLDQKI